MTWETDYRIEVYLDDIFIRGFTLTYKDIGTLKKSVNRQLQYYYPNTWHILTFKHYKK